MGRDQFSLRSAKVFVYRRADITGGGEIFHDQPLGCNIILLGYAKPNHFSFMSLQSVASFTKIINKFVSEVDLLCRLIEEPRRPPQRSTDSLFS